MSRRGVALREDLKCQKVLADAFLFFGIRENLYIFKVLLKEPPFTGSAGASLKGSQNLLQRLMLNL